MRHIDRKNRPLLDLPAEHPAHAVLRAHLECRRLCVGREIRWSGREHEAIDQEWQSGLDGRTWRFSEFAYKFVSFDLILNEWIEHPPFVTEAERMRLQRVAECLTLLDECEEAARRDGNTMIMELIAVVRRFFVLWDRAIRLRIEQDGLRLDHQ